MLSDKIPYVFLDFDGVCTAYDATPGSYVTNSSATYGASERCVKNLMRLVSETGAKIVISSNWRKFGPNGIWRANKSMEICNPLPKFLKMLGDTYIGSIPPVRHVRKPQAIAMWFEENGFDPVRCKYVILDDDMREGFTDSDFAGHFIMTNPATGLTGKDCDRAREILSISDDERIIT